ncbi:MAG: hypothetical protein HQK53_04450 [Oligoflexia bacterium]|nr:hypothetical protein [Oligoflexia bacterium]
MKKINIGLIGTGKTGIKIRELIENNHNMRQDFALACSFDINHRIEDNLDQLLLCDIVIVFVPGNANLQFIPILIENKKAAIFGSTGFEWPTRLSEQLIARSLTWCWSSNFSLGMLILKRAIKILGEGLSYSTSFPKIEIEETHHIHKKDAPSGTALRWKEWLIEGAAAGGAAAAELSIPIVSHRQGEVLGRHQLTIESACEKIFLSHDALDRTLFAEGALFAARKLYQCKTPRGLITFDQLIN